ncbi:MAG: hypothetical protein JRJ04_13300 [Deltaproteobacteria bacterium]|nr:hypothetical protein [Deltaproteobacteria bacterium]
MEFVYQTGPCNALVSSLRRNMYSGVSPDEILNSIVDGTRAYAVFNSKEKIKEILLRIQKADEGISIIVSGLIDRIRKITEEMGLDPHTINISLGILGNTAILPPADIRQLTTMCGHGMVSPNLVRDVIRKIKTHKTNPWQGSLTLASPCICGIVNPHRSAQLLKDTAPLYTVKRL